MSWNWSILFALALAVVAGCTNLKVVVRSEPSGAEVWIKDRLTGKRNILGITPLEVSPDAIDWVLGASKDSNKDYWEVLISKEGYQTAQYFLPRKSGTSVSGLTATLVPGVDDERAKVVIERLFTAQNYAVKGVFDKAHKEVDHVLRTWPRFGRAYTMRGSIYILQRKYQDALEAYETAQFVDATLTEAKLMAAELRRFLGRREEPIAAAIEGAPQSPAVAGASPAPADGAVAAATPGTEPAEEANKKKVLFPKELMPRQLTEEPKKQEGKKAEENADSLVDSFLKPPEAGEDD